MPSSGYTAIEFVAGEQPTTAKWNLIGSNDASFNNGNGFEDNIILDRHIMTGNLKANKFSNPYKFFAYRNSAYTPGSGNAIVYDTEVFDTNGNFNTANGRYTVPVDGFYQINVMTDQNVSAAPQDPQLQLRKNGTTVIGYQHIVNMYNGSSGLSLSLSGIYQLVAGDYLDVLVGNLPISGGISKNNFSGFLVSTT